MLFETILANPLISLSMGSLGKIKPVEGRQFLDSVEYIKLGIMNVEETLKIQRQGKCFSSYGSEEWT